jgi:hypothetical protein
MTTSFVESVLKADKDMLTNSAQVWGCSASLIINAWFATRGKAVAYCEQVNEKGNLESPYLMLPFAADPGDLLVLDDEQVCWTHGSGEPIASMGDIPCDWVIPEITYEA